MTNNGSLQLPPPHSNSLEQGTFFKHHTTPSNNFAVVRAFEAGRGEKKKREVECNFERRASNMWPPPVVDMADPSATSVISKACKDHGIFYLENHGVPEEMIRQVFDQAKAFFNLDVEEKLKLRWNKKKRGYKPVGEELVNQANMSKGGTKEVFEMWRDFDPDSEEARKPLRGPNQWPAESLLPGWKAIMKDYYDTVNTLAERVAVLLAVSVGVDPACIEGHFSQSMNDMRLLHYLPEISDPGQGVFGIGEHADVGVMTLLVTDEPGLQALVNGEWLDVPSRPGAFICNIADMFEMWTNDHLRAPVHRVVNKHGRERYTVAVVASPDFNAKVVCQPQFCSEDNPAKYPPSTCGIHFLEKFQEMYGITE